MNSVLYIFGCFMAVAVRACMWFDSQPAGTGFKQWFSQRKWSNLGSLLIGGLGVWAWNDGTLLSWLPGDAFEKVAVTTGASPIAGFFATLGGRVLVSKTLDKIGANGKEKP